MIFLDYNATTPPLREVVEHIKELLDNTWGNPSSTYEFGLKSKRIIENARNQVAKFINAEPNEIYFTPSASFANNQAIIGYITEKANKCYNFVTTNIEHSSIIGINGNFNTNIVKCNADGLIEKDLFLHYRNCLVSVMGANNEIGTIQPIKEIAEICHKNNCVFHTDLTQYIPYNKVDVKLLGCDMATFSGHKLGALKGIGVLYIKDGIKIKPLIAGHQENDMIGGTENIYGIASIGKVCELLSYENYSCIADKRNYFANKLIFELKDYEVNINGSLKYRTPNNISLTINRMNLNSQQLIVLLDKKGYCLSSGSACNSGINKPSYVLKAIGLTDEEANKTIRICISKDITKEEIDKFIFDLQEILHWC